MSKKDSLIKEIDEISERVRFWHNAILTLLTGVGGMIFAITQEKAR
jgi:Cu/Ag efflux protein CusF